MGLFPKSQPEKDEYLRSMFMSNPEKSLDDYFTVGGQALWGENDMKERNLHQYGTLGFLDKQQTSSISFLSWENNEENQDMKPEKWEEEEEERKLIFLNTHEPFCAVAVGVQGSGKSHSLLTIIENCMLNCPPVTSVPTPTSTLVFHYDSDPNNLCEAICLASPHPTMHHPGVDNPCVKRVVVLVSPSYYKQRCKIYHDVPNCTIHPLLFDWDDLTASNLLSIMRVDTGTEDQPLYIGLLLDELRKAQKRDHKPSFHEFCDSLTGASLSQQQGGPLSQRFRLLKSMVKESDENRSAKNNIKLHDLLNPGTLIIADLTDPMLAPNEANGVFQVLLSQFQSSPTVHPKLVVFDEAHKYLDAIHPGQDALSRTIVHIVRQMRHHGIRVAISSQSPNTLPAELLELASIALIHRFHSKDWFHYLKLKLALNSVAFDEIITLPPGKALCFSTRWAESLITDNEYTDTENSLGYGVRKIYVRARMTSPSGLTKVSL